MLKAIFFDYHGVLDKRTFSSFLQFLGDSLGPAESKKILEKYLPLGKEYASGTISSQKFWQMIENDGVSEEILNKAKEYILTVEKNKEIWDLLPRLRKKYFLGILSDCPDDKARAIQTNVQIADFFDRWYFSSDYTLSKKDRRFMLLMTNDGDFLPEECLFVDDSEENIKSAQELGFQTILYKGKNNELKSLI